MSQLLRSLVVFGTRPEAIKLAPLIAECRRRSDRVEAVLCNTGQHREMLRHATDYFGISGGIELGLMTPDQSLAAFAARCLTALDETIAVQRPDCVVAQGDTTTAMIASLAAFYRRVPYVHVEAGLRTGDLNAPWPEELNRRIADLSAAIFCAPTRRAAETLLGEGAPPARVHVTGNTVIDALLATAARERHSPRWPAKHAYLGDRRMVLITGHRRESFGPGFESICRALAALAAKFPEIDLVYPVHLNPNVREPVYRLLAGQANIHLYEPAPYDEFVWLMQRSTIIVTDSGGIQEEAPSLGKPVLVMRDTTERPEAVEVGAAVLVGTAVERIVETASRLLTDPAEYARHVIPADQNPFGDGHAAERIVELMATSGW